MARIIYTASARHLGTELVSFALKIAEEKPQHASPLWKSWLKWHCAKWEGRASPWSLASSEDEPPLAGSGCGQVGCVSGSSRAGPFC
eukprot:5596247-Amphidinium_carterae.1